MHPAIQLLTIHELHTISKNGHLKIFCDTFANFAVGQQPWRGQVSTRLNFVQNVNFPR